MTIARYVRRIRGTAEFSNTNDAIEIGVDDSGTLKFQSPTGGLSASLDTTSTQTITGPKTFTGALAVSGAMTFTAAMDGVRMSYASNTATSTTLGSSGSGKMIVCSGAAGAHTFTLPATVAGVFYIFVCADAAVEIVISPNANDKIQGKGITAADNKDYVNTDGTNAVGDLVMIVGDGTDGWWVTDERGTWARET